MAFETYVPKTRRQSAEPRVSVNASGIFHVNAAAVDEWFSKTKAVQLLFDPEKRLVAIKSVAADTANSLKLRRPARVAGAQISARGFLDFYQLKADKARQAPLAWQKDVGAAVFKYPG